jgi:hypothetical protein
MAQIEITWKAFGNRPEVNRFISSVQFDTEFNIAEHDVDNFLEVVYSQTNFYKGNLWNLIEPLLSPTRTHTALSVGDEIKIDNTTYTVANCGFEKVGA